MGTTTIPNIYKIFFPMKFAWIRDVARLSTSGWQDRNIFSFYNYFLSVFPHFLPQIVPPGRRTPLTYRTWIYLHYLNKIIKEYSFLKSRQEIYVIFKIRLSITRNHGNRRSRLWFFSFLFFFIKHVSRRSNLILVILITNQAQHNYVTQ